MVHSKRRTNRPRDLSFQRTPFRRLPATFGVLALAVIPPVAAQSVEYRSPAGVEYRSQRDTGAIARAESALGADPRNVDKIITDNEVAVKDTLRNFETFTASLSSNGERLTSIVASAESGVTAIDKGFAKTEDLLKSLGSDKYGGELLPTIISLRELIESFDKKSGALIADTRKMLGDLSTSINKSDPRPPARGR